MNRWLDPAEQIRPSVPRACGDEPNASRIYRDDDGEDSAMLRALLVVAFDQVMDGCLKAG